MHKTLGLIPSSTRGGRKGFCQCQHHGPWPGLHGVHLHVWSHVDTVSDEGFKVPEGWTQLCAPVASQGDQKAAYSREESKSQRRPGLPVHTCLASLVLASCWALELPPSPVGLDAGLAGQPSW